MGFTRRKNKKIKIIIVVIGIIALIGGISYIQYYLYLEKYKQAEISWQSQIEALELESYYNSRIVYVANRNIQPGEKLVESMLEEKEITASIPQEYFITKEDIGTYALIHINEGIPILESMMYEEEVVNNIRKQEFNMILLPSNIVENEYVDVRISFPNGEDYIVLSKKKLRQADLKTNTMCLWLKEEEILTISSAIVDAYLTKGTKLYTTIYVEPTVQEAAIVNYPVNYDVLSIIKDNPNILSIAESVLAEEARELLEERLALLSAEAVNNVEVGIEQEDMQRVTKIETDQIDRVSEEEDIAETTPITEDEEANTSDEFFD